VVGWVSNLTRVEQAGADEPLAAVGDLSKPALVQLTWQHALCRGSAALEFPSRAFDVGDSAALHRARGQQMHCTEDTAAVAKTEVQNSFLCRFCTVHLDVLSCCAVLCCAVLCCAVLCCAVLCCAVLCCAGS
jgi:hypothetical protein